MGAHPHRYIWEKYYADLPDEAKARWEELNKNENREADKQKQKNALINACDDRDKSVKSGATISTKITVAIQKTLKVTRSNFDESWMDGQPVVILKAQLGKELYQDGTDSGGIIEKVEDGRRMAFFVRGCCLSSPAAKCIHLFTHPMYWCSGA